MATTTDTQAFAPGADPTVTDVDVWDSLSQSQGPGWDDSTDIRTRYGDADEDERPRVERIRTRKGPGHVPGAPWSSTPCLCSCHFGGRGFTCDDGECAKWGAQNAARAAKQQDRKQTIADRKRARQVGA